MTEISGTFVVDGKPVRWMLNPVSGGWLIDLTTDAIQLSGVPSEEAAVVALNAYQQGIHRGEHLGRRHLQNDFRNLMGLQ